MPLWRQCHGETRVGDRIEGKVVAEIRQIVPPTILVRNRTLRRHPPGFFPGVVPEPEVPVPFARLVRP